LSILRVRNPKSRCQQSHAEICRGILPCLILVLGHLLEVFGICGLQWHNYSLCLCCHRYSPTGVSVTSDGCLLKRTLVIFNCSPPYLGVASSQLITSATTLFSNKLTFWEPDNLDFDTYIFEGHNSTRQNNLKCFISKDKILLLTFNSVKLFTYWKDLHHIFLL
jgi:hypothetical protein